MNIDFLKNDEVKAFVDLLEAEGKIGKEISFSAKLSILQEGQIRFDNLIPPGYMDQEKVGIEKFGDLFVWKSILAVAKEQNVNIIFVCNDVKEDWWEKDKEIPIDLRKELLKEFKEVNPFLAIQFLTLEKFFSYIAEELQIGKSKSALQLSAMDDAKVLLDKHNNLIVEKIEKTVYLIDIEAELEDEYLKVGEKRIFWNINDVSVDKEEHNIIYYINLDISVLVDLLYQEPGEYPYPAGKFALALEGNITLSMEEYASESSMESLEVKLGDIQHIELEEWQALKIMYNRESCKELIIASRELKKYTENIKKMRENIGIVQNIPDEVYGLQKFVKPFQETLNTMPSKEVLETIQILSKNTETLNSVSKMAEPLSQIAKSVEPLRKVAKTID